MAVLNPAIVIPCYNRPQSLKRLLYSLQNSMYPQGAPLVFSIDKSENDAVFKIATDFPWPFGEKEIIHHPKQLGLRDNIIFCGDLTDQYGSVIILEDDLFVSPAFYSYALKALEFYQDHEEIAGISLYAYDCTETRRFRFFPVYDGYDNYFMQWPSSWGQAWTSEQWRKFKNWYEIHRTSDLASSPIPQSVKNWPKTSWKKYFLAYMVDCNRYFVYPRISFSTNFGDNGTHDKKSSSSLVQVPLSLSANIEPRYSLISDSNSIYDSFFQLEPSCLKQLAPFLREYDFVVDLEGVKSSQSPTDAYTLSTRRCRKPMMSFDCAMKPYEMNVINQIEGKIINFGKTEDFDSKLKWFKDSEVLTRFDRVLSPMDYPWIIIYKFYYKFSEMLHKCR